MINIAIDGPSGAGKSTIARRLASKLGYIYADTGALYRAVALGCSQAGIESDNSAEVSRLLPRLKVELKYTDDGQRVLLNGEDVSDNIRTPEISQSASKLSVLPDVRAFLLELQREIAEKNNVIMDGRDIGTVVLPEAQIKIFLTASAEDRAQRRCDELVLRGVATDYETVLREITERDNRDANREVAPTRPASDAELIDTTGNTLEKSVDVLEKFVMQRLVALGVL